MIRRNDEERLAHCARRFFVRRMLIATGPQVSSSLPDADCDNRIRTIDEIVGATMGALGESLYRKKNGKNNFPLPFAYNSITLHYLQGHQ